MNLPPNAGHGFCGHCGASLPGPVRFCPSCGQTLAAPAPPAPPAHEQLDWGRTAPRPGRRRNLLVTGGLAVLLLAGGSVAAALLLDGSDSRLLTGGALPEPVGDEPQERWTWRSPGSGGASVGVAVGDVLVVGSGDGGTLTALDEDGEALWTSDVGGYPFSYAQHDEIVIVSPLDLGEVVALSIDDGEELWSFGDSYPSHATDAGIVANDYEAKELSVLDPETGEDRWSVAGVDTHAVTGDAVYVLDGSVLSRIAAESGDEEWSVRTDFEADDETYVSLAATDDMVVLGDDEVVAFDAEDGGELWSEDGGVDSTEVGTYSASRVSVATGDYSQDPVVEAVTIYDREGWVGDLDLDEGEYFSGTPFEVAGTPYTFDVSDNRVLDENLDEIGRYDGQVTLVDGGLYALDDDGELSFYELGASSPEWSIDTGATMGEEGSGASVVAFDGRVVVLAADDVVAYQ